MTLRKRQNTGNWKKEALDRILWGTHFGRGYEPVVKPTTKWIFAVPPYLEAIYSICCLTTSQVVVKKDSFNLDTVTDWRS
jgi:hypothetical protein